MLCCGNHSCLSHAGLEKKVIMRKSAQEKYQGPVPLVDEGAVWKHNGNFGLTVQTS